MIIVFVQRMSNVVEHIGYIEEIFDDHVSVRINQASACSGCSVAHLCKTSESKEKVVEVPMESSLGLNVGDEVTILASAKQGLKAVLIAYFVPLCILLFLLVLSNASGMSDACSVVLSVGLLSVYYTALYMLRKHIKKIITFKITNITKTKS